MHNLWVLYCFPFQQQTRATICILYPSVYHTKWRGPFTLPKPISQVQMRRIFATFSLFGSDQANITVAGWTHLIISGVWVASLPMWMGRWRSQQTDMVRPFCSCGCSFAIQDSGTYCNYNPKNRNGIVTCICNTYHKNDESGFLISQIVWPIKFKSGVVPRIGSGNKQDTGNMIWLYDIVWLYIEDCLGCLWRPEAISWTHRNLQKLFPK